MNKATSGLSFIAVSIASQSRVHRPPAYFLLACTQTGQNNETQRPDGWLVLRGTSRNIHEGTAAFLGGGAQYSPRLVRREHCQAVSLQRDPPEAYN